MKYIKKILLIFIIILVISSGNCIGYLGHLALGQTQILWNRKKISNLVQTSNDLIFVEKLKLTESAKKFAVEKLKLNPESGYEYFTSLNRKEVGWHVTASYPLKFESYTWWFPIVGSVPYKGYFDFEQAKLEEEILIAKGFDTRLRITAGYSTLGWFSDPLLSPQLKLRKDELVALVFHEMAHATVYFNGDSNFNESYASFVEDFGADMYFNSLNTPESLDILKLRKQAKSEKKIILTNIKIYGQKLKSLYDSNESDELKRSMKNEIIEEFRSTILDSSKNFQFVDKKNFSTMKINNETFISALRYNSGEEYFLKIYESVGKNPELFHNEMRKLISLSKEERKKLLTIN